MSAKSILDRYLIVTMPNGERWAVPVRVIAEDRAKEYAHEFDGDVAKSLEEDTLRLFQDDEYEIKDWAAGNMNWSDVKPHAKLLPTAPRRTQTWRSNYCAQWSWRRRRSSRAKERTMLAEYLATEQAREDVARLLAAPYPRRIDAIVEDMPAVMSLYPADAWTRVSMTAQTFMQPGNPQDAGCYYRPDDDRFIVTDLGEGVRALRLRTGERAYGPATGAAMLEKLTLCNIEDSQGNVGALGGLARELELVDVKPADLPDAICRVMLASLRVAGVGR